MARSFLNEYASNKWSAIHEDQKIFVMIDGNKINCAVGKEIKKDIATMVCSNGALRWSLAGHTFFMGTGRNGSPYVNVETVEVPTDDPWGDSQDPNDEVPF